MNYQSNIALQNKIKKQALSWVGTSFHHQGRVKISKNSSGGTDCIGLIIGVADKLSLKSKLGGLLSSYDEKYYAETPNKNELFHHLNKHLYLIEDEFLQPADVLLFNIVKYPQHVGFYIEEGARKLLIHAYNCAGKVCVHEFESKWKSRLCAVFRFAETC